MGALEKAIARRLELRQQLKIVEKFISDCHAFASGEIPSQSASRRMFIKGQPEQALGEIIAILASANRPMRAMDIGAELRRRNTNIVCANLTGYVASIVSRNLDKISRGPHGYELITRSASTDEAEQ